MILEHKNRKLKSDYGSLPAASKRHEQNGKISMHSKAAASRQRRIAGILMALYSSEMRDVVRTPWGHCLQIAVRSTFFISIMLLGANRAVLLAQEVPASAPPAGTTPAQEGIIPDAPDALPYPVAHVVEQKDDRTTVTIESTNPEIKVGARYTLDKDVVITYGDRVLQADHVEYDSDTGDATLTGHVLVTGGPNNERIAASHGMLNTISQTGRFFDVVGSVGIKPSKNQVVYYNGNPFLFTGKVVVKRGPEEYDVYNGTVTSCQLPHPDWLLSSAKFTIEDNKARGSNSIFHLLNVPLLYLPYVTHPTDPNQRQSGVLIPELSNSSSKGVYVGDEVYWAINRSMDITAGTIYYSLRGFSESGTYHYRGLGANFVTAHFSALQDRGYTPPGGVYTNQGGEDITFKGRHDFSPATRIAADTEYLSSYIYREAFTDNFNQAVTTDILSTLYGVHNTNGYSVSLREDRYQGEKPLPQTAAEVVADDPVVNSQITIFHVPSLDFHTTAHEIPDARVLWDFDASAAGLKRTQPGFTTGGVGRLDLHPELSLPFALKEWHFRPSFAVRDTLYTAGKETVSNAAGVPVEVPSSINRSDFEAAVDIRPPVIERTFDSPFLEKVFGSDVTHTIEPDVTYRYVTGVNNFKQILRFDDVDVASDTNELEYGLTQRLFLRPGAARKTHPCRITETPDATDQDKEPDDEPNGKAAAFAPKCSTREFFSWRLAQKTFFNQNFGGAIANGRRNIFDTTLDFTGIAFLTEARGISPLISRLRVRPSDILDVEWDFDYDTGAKKFTTNNIFVDVHEGSTFAGFSYALLDAPGRFYTDGLPSSTSNFDQMRVLLGYGKANKPGLSLAANGGFDLRALQLQYASLQAGYNWNCCGFSVEYRKYELGSVRNEGTETFRLTLANIGSAGNLRRATSLF